MTRFENILIIKMRHLGDVLTTTPLITAAKQAWPETRVSYLVNPGGEDLVRFHPEVHEVLTMPRGKGVRRQLTFLHELRRRKYDLVLELSYGDRGAFLAWVSGARTRVGYPPKARSIVDRRLLFTHLVETRQSGRHTVEFHLDFLRRLGLEPGCHPLAVFWPPEAEASIQAHLVQGGLDPSASLAVVHPSSRWMFKSWRAEGNARVIDYLKEGLDLAVVVTAGPEEKELSFTREILNLTRTAPLNLAGKLTLTEMAALLSRAGLFFGVDSLPMHLAAAVGTPAVALFGPSGEHMWAPWGPGHRVVAKDWDCRPCGRDGCDGSKISRCLVEIEADEVFPVLDEVRARIR